MRPKNDKTDGGDEVKNYSPPAECDGAECRGGHALSARDSGMLKRLHWVCVSSLGLAHTRT